MHWIRTIESFYLGRAKRRSGRTTPLEGADEERVLLILSSSRRRDRDAHGRRVSKLQYRFSLVRALREEIENRNAATNLRAQSARPAYVYAYKASPYAAMHAKRICRQETLSPQKRNLSLNMNLRLLISHRDACDDRNQIIFRQQ